jgi:hypothetical protein
VAAFAAVAVSGAVGSGLSLEGFLQMVVAFYHLAKETKAVLEILLEKRICTREEFMVRLVEAAEEEKAIYEETLSRHFGKSIKLE